MLDRIVMGEVPRKHHIALEGPAGELRFEECLTRAGFDGPYTIMYHEHRPHTHKLVELKHGFALPTSGGKQRMAKRHYRSQDLVRAGGALVDGRVPLLFNRDIAISVAHPNCPDPVYYVNGDGDDLYFVKEGTGVLRSGLGDLRYTSDDYIVVPKGVIHRFVPDEGVAQYMLHVECRSALGLLKQWRNETGQLTMDAPYCHRDFTRPDFQGPMDEGIREILVKQDDAFHGFALQNSPLDVVGWDGTVYPFIFPILNFQPRAGLVHLPPTWHGTFQCRGALVCSFVPRVVDFHPEAIPCPYPHSSVDCDEFLFYVRGNFTSRRGVGEGSVSHHPIGIPHGPHPGAYEASRGTDRTDELAVMIDTFEPLRATASALEIEDPNYQESFI